MRSLHPIERLDGAAERGDDLLGYLPPAGTPLGQDALRALRRVAALEQELRHLRLLPRGVVWGHPRFAAKPE